MEDDLEQLANQWDKLDRAIAKILTSSPGTMTVAALKLDYEHKLMREKMQTFLRKVENSKL